MIHDHDRSAWREAVQAHTRATEAYIQATKAAARALAGPRIDASPEEAVWSDLTRMCCYCGTTFGVVRIQAAVPATTHGICGACLAVEIGKLEHPVTNGRA